MSKTLPKKGVERRKKPRTSKSRGQSRQKVSATSKSAIKEHCSHCNRGLRTSDRALFVEEENRRIFCSEECIAAYYAPDVERLEKEYFRHLGPDDLPPSEKEQMGHLRWLTLEEPDEVWAQKLTKGDVRYTFISEFKPQSESVWCVCLCLCLRGEPSFLFLAFPTRDEELVQFYRRGERVPWERKSQPHQGMPALQQPVAQQASTGDSSATDGLADGWTEDETIRAQITRKRRPDDIPVEEFESYQPFMQVTVEEPDEIWTQSLSENSPRVFHFIRHYASEKPPFWYVVVARETEDEEQIEIMDAFPTHDPELVDEYRRGNREMAGRLTRVPSRMVH